MANILYLTTNGMAEALGQSQVLRYLEALAQEHEIHLISFEKPEDYADAASMARLRAQIEAIGIGWTARRFWRAPRFLSSLVNIADMFFTALKIKKKNKVEIYHARSYIPALVGSYLKALRGGKLLFDMRALWPEELIGAGRIARGGVIHRLLLWAEGRCLRKADHIVSLTDAARIYLDEHYPSVCPAERFSVIPTCVALERFVLPEGNPSDRLVIGCCGTVLSGFFRFDLLARFFAMVAERYPQAELDIVTRDDHSVVAARLAEFGVPLDRVALRSASPEDMPQIYQNQSANVMFFTTDTGKLGSCPTRMGETLACGTPVLINPGIGDVASIAAEFQGIALLEGEDEAALETALARIMELAQQKGVSKACRATAEAYFSLENGVEEYRKIYRNLSPRT